MLDKEVYVSRRTKSAYVQLLGIVGKAKAAELVPVRREMCRLGRLLGQIQRTRQRLMRAPQVDDRRELSWMEEDLKESLRFFGRQGMAHGFREPRVVRRGRSVANVLATEVEQWPWTRSAHASHHHEPRPRLSTHSHRGPRPLYLDWYEHLRASMIAFSAEYDPELD